MERLISLEADQTDIIHTAVTAAWRWAHARCEAIGYITAFASASDKTSADDLVGLAGWIPALNDAQVSQLTDAASGGASREQFVHALHNETELGHTWVNGFLAPPEPATAATTTTENKNG